MNEKLTAHELKERSAKLLADVQEMGKQFAEDKKEIRKTMDNIEKTMQNTDELIEKLRTSVMLDELERYRQDTIWIGDNSKELLKKYNEEYIMVMNKTVVEHGKDLYKLCDRMRKEGKYDPAYCVCDFMTKNPPSLCPSMWEIP